MKNLLKSFLLPVFITLFTISFTACKKDVVDKSPKQPASQSIRVEPETTGNNAASYCGQKVYSMTKDIVTGEWIPTPVPVLCFYLTMDPNWPFVVDENEYFRTIPVCRQPDPSRMVVVPVNNDIAVIESFPEATGRRQNSITLTSPILLNADMKQSLGTTKNIIPAGTYPARYDARRDMSVSFVSFQ